MGSIAIFRAFKSGWVNFWRNFWLSTAATLVMVITLAILTLTLITYNVASVAVKNIQDFKRGNAVRDLLCGTYIYLKV